MNKFKISAMLTFIVFIILYCVYSIIYDIQKGGPIFIIIFMLSIVIFIFNQRETKRSIVKGLQHKNPEKLVKIINKQIKSKKNREMLCTYNQAIIYFFYGKSEVATAIIEGFAWKDEDLMHKISRNTLLILKNYFFEESNLDGLATARKMKALITAHITTSEQFITITTSEQFVPTKKTVQTFQMFVSVGHILNGIQSDEDINFIESKFNDKKVQITIKLICAWALGNAYSQMNRIDKANEMLNFCKKTAPHSIFLHCVKKHTKILTM